MEFLHAARRVILLCLSPNTTMAVFGCTLTLPHLRVGTGNICINPAGFGLFQNCSVHNLHQWSHKCTIISQRWPGIQALSSLLGLVTCMRPESGESCISRMASSLNIGITNLSPGGHHRPCLLCTHSTAAHPQSQDPSHKQQHSARKGDRSETGAVLLSLSVEMQKQASEEVQ